MAEKENTQETPEEAPTPEPAKTSGGKSGTGLEPNVAGALAYVLGLITGVI
ncbi:MAG: hypothetical protein GTN40_01150, partial [Candidatus Aenigmarchaeota archaeon]|nr:hypothetical protein [Candidatus Aenigmarchaeota archaeon]